MEIGLDLADWFTTILGDLFDSDLLTRILVIILYVLIGGWLYSRYFPFLDKKYMPKEVGKVHQVVRGLASGAGMGFITVIMLLCVAIFLIGTGVSLGVVPDDSLQDGNKIATVLAFIIGLTMVSLTLSFYLKKIDRFLQGVSKEDYEFSKLVEFMEKMDYTITFHDEEE